jgi:hypothetical protein
MPVPQPSVVFALPGLARSDKDFAGYVANISSVVAAFALDGCWWTETRLTTIFLPAFSLPAGRSVRG